MSRLQMSYGMVDVELTLHHENMFVFFIDSHLIIKCIP